MWFDKTNSEKRNNKNNKCLRMNEIAEKTLLDRIND